MSRNQISESPQPAAEAKDLVGVASHDLFGWLSAMAAAYQSAAPGIDSDPEEASWKLGRMDGIKHLAHAIFYGGGEHDESMAQYFGFTRAECIASDPLDAILSGKVPIPLPNERARATEPAPTPNDHGNKQ